MQAPISMMNQKRQEIGDGRRAENSDRFNRKAKLEIRMLRDKIDPLYRT
jgi:uncharacterized membrane protein